MQTYLKIRTQKVDDLLTVWKRWLEIFGLFLAFILPAGFQWFDLVLVCNLLCLYVYSDVGLVECPTTWLAGQFAFMKYAETRSWFLYCIHGQGVLTYWICSLTFMINDYVVLILCATYNFRILFSDSFYALPKVKLCLKTLLMKLRFFFKLTCNFGASMIYA